MPKTVRQEDQSELGRDYVRVRQFSEQLCAPLQAEDMGLQACPDVSPPRWHLAHTTWFFETFLLVPHLPGYQPFNPAFEYLFNSYYNGIGEQYPRPQRHLLTRPDNAEVLAWRAQVDDAMQALIAASPGLASLVRLGLNHEQQHQELLLTDIKYSLSFNPLSPAITEPFPPCDTPAPALTFQDFTGGKVEQGRNAGDGFVFDNETPRHPVWLAPFRLANRPVRELMTPRTEIVFIERGTRMGEFLKVYAENAHTRFPVYKGSTEDVVGRAGEPEEQAKAVLFMASEDASFVAGANLFVDGGTMAMASFADPGRTESKAAK